MKTSPRRTFTIDSNSGRFVPKDPPEDLQGHVVFLNANEKLPKIIEEIQVGSQDDPLDIIVLVPDWEMWLRNTIWHPAGSYAGNIYYRQGEVADSRDLQMARVAFAKVAVVLADPSQGNLADAHTTLTAVAIEKLNPEVHTVVELISSVNRVHLQFTKVNEVVCIGELTEKLIAQSCISPGIKKIFEHLLSTGASTMQIFTVPLPESLFGKTYADLARLAIQKDARFIVCGFSSLSKEPDKEPGAKRITVLNPRADAEPGKHTIMGPGDRLITIAYKRPNLEALA